MTLEWGSRLRRVLDVEAGLGERVRLILLTCGTGALVAGVRLVMWLSGFTGVDAAAHVYKTAQVRDSAAALFWDSFWYGGTYGLIDYGPLYYLLAAAIPGVVLATFAGGTIPALTHVYLRAAYGVRTMLPATVLALCIGLYQVNGQDPFLFGLALMMGGLALIGAGRPGLAAVPAGLALFANPLAALVGAVFLVADALELPEMRRRHLRFFLAFLPFVAARIAISALFAQPAAYLSQLPQIALPLAAAIIGAALAWWTRDLARRHLVILFFTYAGLCVIAYALRSLPLGNNVNRFALVFALPLALVARSSRLPRALLIAGLIAIAAIQLQAPLRTIIEAPEPQAADAAFFAPALKEARRLADADHRIHVAALKKHWEARYFPEAGFPITRGWFRQDDAVHNRLFLEEGYTPAQYVAWLRSMGVRYVFLPHAPLDLSSRREPHILSGSKEFTAVARPDGWTVYELRKAEGLVVSLEGDGDGRVVKMGHRSVRLRLAKTGVYLLKVTYSPYWRLVRGVGSLERGQGNWCVVRARSGGDFELRFGLFH